MAGLYIHIPFCKQACYYCDFHFSTNTSYKAQMIDSICGEIELRKSYLSKATIDTIYLGGGTPSILTIEEFQKIMDVVYRIFHINAKAEITIEANPDDLSKEKLLAIKSLGVNRLSIGVQSFQDKILKSLNRAHNAEEAIKCIKFAREVGFDELSIDLIFSIPGQSTEDLKLDLQQAIDLEPEHISVYSLTIEEKTVFGNWLAKGRFLPVSDEASAEQFDLLISTLENKGYEQYEVSNFCRQGHYARHNTSYWKNIPYLGLGPGAHSYNGKSRQYNVSHNNQYMRGISQGQVSFELDEPSTTSLANEYLLTSLRTKWGCDISMLFSEFGYDLLADKKKVIDRFIMENVLRAEGKKLFLTRKGLFLADDIIADLFWIQ